MSNEEFERYKDFILEQQAQSAVKLAQLEDVLARLAENTRELAEASLARFEAHEKRMTEVDEKIAALVDSQIQTEESLKNLAALIDRYFQNRNGKPGE